MSDTTNAGASRIEASLRRATSEGRLALAPFLTAGFPTLDGFGALLDTVAAESDLLELGVPFSDPMADGVTIQRSSRTALEAGVTLRFILDTVRPRESSTPIVLMSYLNPLLAFGLERLGNAFADAHVAGLIVPDLPLEECGPLREAMEASGVALVQLVTPVTPPDRLRELCAITRGFVYAVTQTATTGGAIEKVEEMLRYLDRVRAVSPVPVLAGFGIRRRADMARLAGHADGAIVGSALIEALERGEDPAAFLGALRTGPIAERRKP